MKITIEAEYDGPHSLADDMSELRSAVDTAISRTVGKALQRGELLRYAVKDGSGAKIGHLTLENPE